jgi:hypothetical protein
MMEYTFFSEAHRMFSKVDHTLGHIASLNKYKNKCEAIHFIFSDHNRIKLEMRSKRNNSK